MVVRDRRAAPVGLSAMSPPWSSPHLAFLFATTAASPGPSGCGTQLALWAVALLHLLVFLESDSPGPSRWDKQDYGHMPAAIHICILGQWQFAHRPWRWQSGVATGRDLSVFRKTRS